MRRQFSNNDAGSLLLAVLSALIALAMLFVIVGYARANKPAGAPESTPEEQAWFRQASIPGLGGCCSEADGFREGLIYPESSGLVAFNGQSGHPHPSGVILREWKATPDKAGEYDIKVLDKWMHVDKDRVLPNLPRNPTGGAVAFLVFNYKLGTGDHGQYEIFLRCFSPGNLG